MIKIIMHGCNGKMGQITSELISQDASVEVVAGIDVTGIQKNDYPVYKSLKECQEAADVVIDFTVASAIDGLLDYCIEENLPVILCTTGLSEAQMRKIELSSRKIPILKSANMSLGINTMMKLLKAIAPVLAEAGFDIEIIERHHNQKVDSPSGTALSLAEAVNESLGNTCEYVYDRSRKREKRGKQELGISSVRGGTLVGEHDVIFAGTDEVIEIKHTAYSKAIFSKGTIQAAKFLAGREPGMYDMGNVLG